jgi:hypothetical protein
MAGAGSMTPRDRLKDAVGALILIGLLWAALIFTP